jgi:hypothetical protein
MVAARAVMVQHAHLRTTLPRQRTLEFHLVYWTPEPSDVMTDDLGEEG